MYNDQCKDELKVTCSMFRRIFVNEFNISLIWFNIGTSLRKVTLLYMLSSLLRGKIRCTLLHFTEKAQLMVENRVHSRRPKAFYEHMKIDVPDSLSFLPIQEAYYARQFGFYNLYIIDLKTNFFQVDRKAAGKGASKYYQLSSNN